MTIEIPECVSPSRPVKIAIQIHAITARSANTFGKFALRTITLLTAIFVPAIASASAFLPFTPISPQPDYVVTMVESLFAKDVKRSVTHHGDWTRVDRIGDGYRWVNYYFVNGAVAVRDQRRVSSTSFARGIDLSYRDHAPRNTGERQTHLGETCTVWEVSRPGRDAPSGSGLFHLSCVTDDGIELWQRSIYGSNVTTTGIARGAPAGHGGRGEAVTLALDAGLVGSRCTNFESIGSPRL
jgi:hypothetical protein